MKHLLYLILFLLPANPLIGQKISYKSSCIHYYLPFGECFDRHGYLNWEYAAEKGCNVWVLMYQENGDVIFESRPWGNFQYGRIDDQTVKLNRQQSIEDLNKWINFYYEITKNDKKYRHLGYSTAYFHYANEIKFKACPDFDLYDNLELLKNGDSVNLYVGFGHTTDKVKKNLYITKDHQLIIICPADKTPCIKEGIPNFDMLLKFDIEYYLPKS